MPLTCSGRASWRKTQAGGEELEERIAEVSTQSGGQHRRAHAGGGARWGSWALRLGSGEGQRGRLPPQEEACCPVPSPQSLSPVLEAEAELQVRAGRFPPRPLSWAFGRRLLPMSRMAVPLHLCVLTSPHEDTVILDLGPPQGPRSTFVTFLRHLFKSLISKYGHILRS